MYWFQDFDKILYSICFQFYLRIRSYYFVHFKSLNSQHVRINQSLLICFFFIEIGYENVFELQRGRCAHCLFLYIVRKEHSCWIPSSFHVYCAKHFLPLWFILAWRSFICLRTAFDITSRVLPSMTNATQWILFLRFGSLIYPGVSGVKATKGLNYNIFILSD